MASNPGCKFDLKWIDHININVNAIKDKAIDLQNRKLLQGPNRAAWLLKAVTLIDLTTLGGDDTPGNVSRLCFKAAQPIASDLLKALGFDYQSKDCPIHTAAVCVYPAKSKTADETLSKLQKRNVVNVAAVATGFPSGQYSLESRLKEIEFAVQQGANEIDIVIDRSLVLTGKWHILYEELRAMKEACGPSVHMKAILATGELETLRNVYKASMVAMMAGADFIKTSTGKEAVNATIPFGIVMARAIKEYYFRTGIKVGLKPAGGIRTSQDALEWLVMVKDLLGDEWLSPELFRFGASGLLSSIEHSLFEFVTGFPAEANIFTMG